MQLTVLIFLLLCGCATQQFWYAPQLSGQTMSRQQPLGGVQIYREDSNKKNRKLIGESDSKGNFELKPLGERHTCYLLGCMGDYAAVRGAYVFTKFGYVDTSVPYAIASVGKQFPELEATKVSLQPRE